MKVTLFALCLDGTESPELQMQDTINCFYKSNSLQGLTGTKYSLISVVFRYLVP